MLKQSFVQEKLSDLATSADSAIKFKSTRSGDRSMAGDRSSREVSKNGALRFNLKASQTADLSDMLNEHFPESSRAASDYYYKNNIKFIQAQHQDVLKGLQEELELTKEKNRNLLFRLNVASLAGGGGGSESSTTASNDDAARNMLKGDLDLYAAQNRNLSQLLELNEKKNQYLLELIDDIQNKAVKASQALVPVDPSQVQQPVSPRGERPEDLMYSLVDPSAEKIKMPDYIRNKNKSPACDLDELEQTRRNRQTRKLIRERHRKDHF